MVAGGYALIPKAVSAGSDLMGSDRNRILSVLKIAMMDRYFRGTGGGLVPQEGGLLLKHLYLTLALTIQTGSLHEETDGQRFRMFVRMTRAVLPRKFHPPQPRSRCSVDINTDGMHALRFCNSASGRSFSCALHRSFSDQ